MYHPRPTVRTETASGIKPRGVVGGRVSGSPLVHVNLAKRRDLALRQHLRAVILERYQVRPLEGEGTKKSDEIEWKGVGLKDSGLLHWQRFLARQQSKNDEDRWRQEGAVPQHCPTHFQPFRSPGEYQLVKQTYLLLQASGFYWGSLSMEHAHHMLRETAPGTFLIRDSYQCNVFFTLSLHGEDGPKSIRLLLSNQLFGLDGSGKTFDSLFALLVHYITSSTKIVAPYRRQRPETLQQLARKAVIRAHGAHAIDSLPGLSGPVRAYLHAYPFWV